MYLVLGGSFRRRVNLPARFEGDVAPQGGCGGAVHGLSLLVLCFPGCILGIFSLLDGGGDDGMLVGNLLPLGGRCGGDDMGRKLWVRKAHGRVRNTGLQLHVIFTSWTSNFRFRFLSAFCGSG